MAGQNDVATQGASTRGARSASYPWYVLAVLTLVHVSCFMDRSVISVIAEPLKAEFQITDGQLGLLYGSTYVLPFALASIPLGFLIDRVNRRNLLAGIIAFWSAFTALAGFAQSYLALIAARLGVGVTEAGELPTCMSLISDYFGPRRRATAVGIWSIGAQVGFITTFLVGGAIAQQHGWRPVFFLAGVPGLIVVVLLITTVREPARGRTEEGGGGKAPSIREVGRFMLGRTSVIHLMTAMVLHTFTTSGLSFFMTSFLVRQHHLPLSKASMLVALSLGLCGGVGTLVAGIVSDRVANLGGSARPWRLASVCTATALGTLIAGFGTLFAGPTGVAVVILFIYASVSTAYAAPAHSLMLTLLNPRMRGTGIAVTSSISNLIGVGLGSLVVGALSDAIGGADSLRWAMGGVLLINTWAAAHFFVASMCASREMPRLGTVRVP